MTEFEKIIDESLLFDYYELGLGTPIGISCEQGKGLGDLLDTICSHFDAVDTEGENERIKIAIII